MHKFKVWPEPVLITFNMQKAHFKLFIQIANYYFVVHLNYFHFHFCIWIPRELDLKFKTNHVLKIEKSKGKRA